MRLSLSSYRHGFHGGQTLFRGTPRRRPDDRDRIVLLYQLFRKIARKCAGRIGTVDQCLHGQRNVFLSGGPSVRMFDVQSASGAPAHKAARRDDANLVRPLFDGRGTLFDCNVAPGKLGRGGRSRHRDRRLRYRHQCPGSRACRHFRRARADALKRGSDRQVFLAHWPGALANHRRAASVDALYVGQYHGAGRNAAARSLRRHLLPKPAYLFRRHLAPRGGGESL